MSCTCIKDLHKICRVHPLEYEQIEVMGKHIAKLQAERDSLKGDMQRIYDNCSDTDLIIDIASAALEVEYEY